MGATAHRATASAGLSALIRQVWGPPDDYSDAAWPVRVTWGPAPASGFRPVESYIVVPSVGKARLLVPATRRAAVAFLRQNGSLRPRAIRWSRAALAVGAWTGATQHVAGDRLVVWVDDKVPPRQLANYLVRAHLERELDRGSLSVGIGVHEPDPNYKPSLQLYDSDGTPVGYAKVGWNAITRELVDNEAAALRSLRRTPPRLVTVPAARYAGSWAGRSLLVANPLPKGVRRYPNWSLPPGPDVMSDLAGRTRSHSMLRQSSYWRGVLGVVDVLARDDNHPDFSSAVRRYAAALEEQMAHIVFEFGRWHGDWVPWNVGCIDSTMYVWDWEHSGSDVPVGFDFAHWHFQVAFVWERRPLHEALQIVRDACSRGSALLGMPREQGCRVAALYLLEVALRSYRLMRGGGGWNPRIYPAVLDALSSQRPHGE